MRRKATLVIAGDVMQALRAVAAHDITKVESTTDAPTDKNGRVTKVVLDGEAFNRQIERWFDERVNPGDRAPGSLIAAAWV